MFTCFSSVGTVGIGLYLSNKTFALVVTTFFIDPYENLTNFYPHCPLRRCLDFEYAFICSVHVDISRTSRLLVSGMYECLLLGMIAIHEFVERVWYASLYHYTGVFPYDISSFEPYLGIQ